VIATKNTLASPVRKTAMDSTLFRVDKFAVPTPARGEFLDKVYATQALLRTQKGFLRDAILEQTSGPAEFNFITIVEWESESAIEPARQAVAALHRRMNFDPREMLARLGIRAEIGNYKRAEMAKPAGNEWTRVRPAGKQCPILRFL
jgi:heme-degrading monooxygenase HmoA